jgi:hypothetical protein
MSVGFFIEYMLSLSVKYWYYTLPALIIKFFLIRFVVTNTFLKAIGVSITGLVCFYVFACITAWMIFSSAPLSAIPFLIFFFGLLGEIIVCCVMFRLTWKHFSFIAFFGDGLLFGLMLLDITG